MERARARGTPICGALLDYTKFFDYFDIEFAWNLMINAGFPSDVAYLIANLMHEIIRYLKFGGQYDAKMDDCNGTPQGCSLSIMIANIYVTTLFNMLYQRYHNINMGSIIDARNIRLYNPKVLLQAIESVIEFDEIAGHETNIERTIIWSTHDATRADLNKQADMWRHYQKHHR